MDVDPGGGASRSTDPASGTSSATDVSLREFVDVGFQRMTERFGFMLALGAVIWFFIERHLASLNHENARVAAITETRLSQQTYDANEQQRNKEAESLDEWRKEVDRDRTQSVSRTELQQETKTDRRSSGAYGWVWVTGIVAVVAVIVAVANFAAIHTGGDKTPATSVVCTADYHPAPCTP